VEEEEGKEAAAAAVVMVVSGESDAREEGRERQETTDEEGGLGIWRFFVSSLCLVPFAGAGAGRLRKGRPKVQTPGRHVSNHD
jgi:hypothetical protein